jgi:hypothetical protein
MIHPKVRCLGGIALLLGLVLSACDASEHSGSGGIGSGGIGSQTQQAVTHQKLDCDNAILNIRSGSENEALVPLLKRFNDGIENYLPNDAIAAYRASGKKCAVSFSTQGSATISKTLTEIAGLVSFKKDVQLDSYGFNVVWPAQRRWLADQRVESILVDTQSVMTSPVVMAIKPSYAKALAAQPGSVIRANALAGSTPVYLSAKDACALWEKANGVAITNVTHSNSGNTAAIVCLGSKSGNPSELEVADANNSDAAKSLAALLQKTEFTSGSTTWLNQVIVKNYDQVNLIAATYESTLADLNRELARQGKEQFVPIYSEFIPADSPIALLDVTPAATSAEEKTQRLIFHALQQYLLAPEQQIEIALLGRRPVGVGVPSSAVKEIKDATGVSLDYSPPSTFVVPKLATLQQVNAVVQQKLRRPTAIVFVRDNSGSMLELAQSGRSENKEQQLEKALGLVLDPSQAEKAGLQATDRDVFTIVAYGNDAQEPQTFKGNDPKKLLAFYQSHIAQSNAEEGWGTNTYAGLLRGMQYVTDNPNEFAGKNVLYVVLSDGVTNGGISSASEFVRYLNSDVVTENPSLYATAQSARVYTISFGEDAGEDDLRTLAQLMNGQYVHADTSEGLGGLREAFRKFVTE